MSRVNFKSTGWKHFIYRPGNPTPPTPDRVVGFRQLGMFSNFKYVSLLKFSEFLRLIIYVRTMAMVSSWFWIYSCDKSNYQE